MLNLLLHLDLSASEPLAHFSSMNWYAMSRRHSRARYTIVMNCVLSLLFLASDI